MADDLQVVVVAAYGLGVVGQVQFPFQRPVRAVFHERGIARIGQVEGPAFLSFRLGRLRCRFPDKVRQAGQPALVRDVERIGVGRRQHVFAVLEAQQGKLLDVFAISLLVGRGEVGAAPGKLLVGVVKQFVLVRGEAETVPLLPDGLDPGEKGLVEGDVHLVFRHLGGEILGDLLHFVVRIGLQQVVKDAGYAVQGASVVLEGFDGVGKVRRIGIGDDGIDPGLRFREGLLEGRHIMLVADLVKGWGSVGELGFSQKRIFHSA